VKIVGMLLCKNPNLRASIDEILSIPEINEEKMRILPKC